MGKAHRITTVQLFTLLLTSALVGACITLMISRPGLARAEAAPPRSVRQGDNSAAKTDEKKKGGRPVVHFEIGCRDTPKTKDFYAKLFDWQIHTEGPMTDIKTGAGKGIDGHIVSLGHDPQNYITF